MERRTIAYSPMMKGDLDDDYTLFDNGEILHEYDKSRYPGGYNLKRTLTAAELRDDVKQRLLNATGDSDRELAKRLLGL